MITNPRRRHLYNISFKKAIHLLSKSGMDGKAIASESDKMVEQYYSDLGEMPGSDILDLIADAILTRDLSEKVKTLEYSILSESQLRRIKNPTTNRRKSNYVYHEIELESQYVNYVYYRYAEPYIYTRDYSTTNSRKRITLNKRVITDYPRAQWSSKVRDRDMYQCQNCNSRSGIMHAHHIENYADNPHLRYELSNGITLCERCHVEFHKIYGVRDTNKSDLDEFLGYNRTS